MQIKTLFRLIAETNVMYSSINELAKNKPKSHQRRNPLTSIENIQREIVSRAPCP